MCVACDPQLARPRDRKRGLSAAPSFEATHSAAELQVSIYIGFCIELDVKNKQLISATVSLQLARAQSSSRFDCFILFGGSLPGRSEHAEGWPSVPVASALCSRSERFVFCGRVVHASGHANRVPVHLRAQPSASPRPTSGTLLRCDRSRACEPEFRLATLATASKSVTPSDRKTASSSSSSSRSRSTPR